MISYCNYLYFSTEISNLSHGQTRASRFRFEFDRVGFCDFSFQSHGQTRAPRFVLKLTVSILPDFMFLMDGQTRAPRFVLSLTVTILVNCHFIARSKSSAAFWFDFWPWRFWWIFVFNERSNSIQFEKRKNRVTWIRICGFDFKNQDGQTQNEMKLARLTVS